MSCCCWAELLSRTHISYNRRWCLVLVGPHWKRIIMILIEVVYQWLWLRVDAGWGLSNLAIISPARLRLSLLITSQSNSSCLQPRWFSSGRPWASAWSCQWEHQPPPPAGSSSLSLTEIPAHCATPFPSVRRVMTSPPQTSGRTDR